MLLIPTRYFQSKNEYSIKSGSLGLPTGGSYSKEFGNVFDK